MSTRNRLTKKPNMRARYKTRVEVRQGALLLGFRVSRFGPSRGRAAGTAAPSQRQRMRGAAFCRRLLVVLLFLSACAFDTPRVFADTSNEAPGSSRTEDHVHVTARRAGESLLITLRIDPGYHVNANPASDDYLIATSVAFAGAVPERIVYPPGIPFKPAFADKPIEVYEGTVVVAATFTTEVLERTHDLGFRVTAQACTKVICLPPNDITARATW
jgi:hypothetical protein